MTSGLAMEKPIHRNRRGPDHIIPKSKAKSEAIINRKV
jgi:hypothetical protein